MVVMLQPQRASLVSPELLASPEAWGDLAGAKLFQMKEHLKEEYLKEKQKPNLLSEGALVTLRDLKHKAQAVIPAVLVLQEPSLNHMSLQQVGKRRNPLDGLDTPCLDGGMSFSTKILGEQRTRQRLQHLS